MNKLGQQNLVQKLSRQTGARYFGWSGPVVILGVRFDASAAVGGRMPMPLRSIANPEHEVFGYGFHPVVCSGGHPIVYIMPEVDLWEIRVVST